MDKFEKLLICGQSGSGKDFIASQLRELGYLVGVKTTTRPKRKKEIQGITYKFTQNENFNINDMIVYEEFKNHLGDRWLYGFEKEEFNNKQVFIMTPGELNQIEQSVRENCFIVYLDIDEETRRSRLFNRADKNDSIERRLLADKNDFADMTDWDLKVTDPEFSVEMIISLWD